MSKPKRPRDINQLAKTILDIGTGSAKEKSSKKNLANVEIGRLGGLKGGVERAKKLSPHQRSEIARNAANKRWNKKKH